MLRILHNTSIDFIRLWRITANAAPIRLRRSGWHPEQLTCRPAVGAPPVKARAWVSPPAWPEEGAGCVCPGPRTPGPPS